MSKGLENYVGVAERKAQFRKQNPKGTIKTSVNVSWEQEAAIVTAEISNEDGRLLGTGSAVCLALGEEKDLEKTESTAVGRALDNSGFAADIRYTEGADVEQEEKPAPTKKTASNPLAQRAAKPAATQAAPTTGKTNPLAARAAAPAAKPAAKPVTTPAPTTRRLGGLGAARPVPPPVEASEAELDETVNYDGEEESFESEEV